jgi:hypothetical protein
LALTLACFAAYLGGMALFARPGVFRVILTPAPLAIIFVLGPLAALAALPALGADSLFVEAESFQNPGGWSLDIFSPSGAGFISPGRSPRRPGCAARQRRSAPTGRNRQTSKFAGMKP